MDLGIEGRIAIVTGASRGIGRAIALGLAAEGARVVVAARTADKLEEVRAELDAAAGASRGRHVAVAIDLMAEGAPEELARRAGDLGPVDIVVHNLGGSNGVFQTFAPAADWAKSYQFNVGVGHELNRVLVPAMSSRGYGRVVHVSTLSTTTYNGYASYVAAKCALDGYVKTLSRQVAKDGVVVSAVAPGAIWSEGRYFAKIEKENPAALEKYFDDHLPTRRLGRAEQDVAPVVAFLCSKHAGFMAGSIVGVDGGGY